MNIKVSLDKLEAAAADAHRRVAEFSAAVHREFGEWGDGPSPSVQVQRVPDFDEVEGES